MGPVPVTTGVRDTWMSSVTLNTPEVTKLSWKSVESSVLGFVSSWSEAMPVRGLLLCSESGGGN